MKFVLFAMTLVLAQLPLPPSSSSAEGTVEGVIFGADGPLSGAEVFAYWDPLPLSFNPGSVPRTTTRGDGKFVIRLLAGSYRLQATAPGYARGSLSSDGNGEDAIVRVVPGEPVQELTARLKKNGTISGRVTSTDGQPLVRMEVALLTRRLTANGVGPLQAMGRAETNDRGEYRINGLADGAYYVAASSPNPGIIAGESAAAAVRGVPPPIAPSPGGYAPTFYPAADRSREATLVEVKPGEEVRNIDFVLPKQRVYTIRGRVIDASTGEAPARKPSVDIKPAFYEYLASLGGGVPADGPNGTFEMSGVRPGLYWLTAQLSAVLNPEQRQLLTTPGADVSQLPLPARGVALIRVTDGDVTGIELRIVQNLELGGRLRMESEPSDLPAVAREVKIDLTPIDSAGNGAPSHLGSLEPDGRFRYKRLQPTAYKLTILALPPPFYVKEASFGNTDVFADPILVLQSSGDELDIVLARGVEVRGTVADPAGVPTPNQMVVLIPVQMPNRPDLYKTGVSDARGSFSLQGVAPGEYKAFAWKTIGSFQYFDDTYVRRFEGQGTPVRVTGTASANVRVTSIP